MIIYAIKCLDVQECLIDYGKHSGYDYQNFTPQKMHTEVISLFWFNEEYECSFNWF